ncbi:hypothetical protein ACSSS7_005696 [Eimeria intestinalis]
MESAEQGELNVNVEHAIQSQRVILERSKSERIAVMDTQSQSPTGGGTEQSLEHLQPPPAYDFPGIDDPQARKDLAALLHFLETPLTSAEGDASAQLELKITVADVKVEIVVSKIGPLPPRESILEAAEAVEALVQSTTRFVLDGPCTAYPGCPPP